VPTAAVVTSAAGTSTVRVVDTNGQVETRQVVVGLVSRTLVEIKSGVSAGETVVIGSSTTRTSTSTGAGAIGGGGGFDGGGGGVLRP
jgi:multidrug efflux pump subunit AcrA (membrane-fusion protein)